MLREQIQQRTNPYIEQRTGQPFYFYSNVLFSSYFQNKIRDRPIVLPQKGETFKDFSSTIFIRAKSSLAYNWGFPPRMTNIDVILAQRFLDRSVDWLLPLFGLEHASTHNPS
jgi:hypothetical protein